MSAGKEGKPWGLAKIIALLGIASNHQSDGCAAQEGERVSVHAVPIRGKPAVAIQPSDGALDDSAFWQQVEATNVRAFDDLDADLLANLAQPSLERQPLVAAIGIKLEQEREQAEQ